MIPNLSISFQNYSSQAKIKQEAIAAKTYDILEMVIKLGINSLYGKTDQSKASGYGENKVPRTANPWYAAAITAGTRRKLIEALCMIRQRSCFLQPMELCPLGRLMDCRTFWRKANSPGLAHGNRKLKTA